MTDSFPRLAARTNNFRLGVPRAFAVGPDGTRVLFVRARSGDTREHVLWVWEDGEERVLADPAELLDAAEDLTPEERARRERARETTAGVVAFSTDTTGDVVAFALSSRLFVAAVGAGTVRELPVDGPVIDPRVSPDGGRVAYADGRALHVVELATGADTTVAGPEDSADVVWGLAEFIAGEELGRGRGYWWSPDGTRLLVERYDESPVLTWHIADPAFPERPPTPVRYPQAGTANAVVGLAVVGPDGSRVDLDWRSDTAVDGTVLEYLVHVDWSEEQPLLVLLTRDQRRLEYRTVDPGTGTTSLVRTVTDDAWVELLPGTPRRWPDGRLLHAMDVDDTRRLYLDDEPFTPADVIVRSVVTTEDDSVIAEIVTGVGAIGVARLHLDGRVETLSESDGVAGGASAGGTLVIAQMRADTVSTQTAVLREGTQVGTIVSVAYESPLVPRPITRALGPSATPVTVLFPTGHEPGSRRLPVLLDPYGGPHGQRVLNAGRAHLQSQWFADQGFLVIVADGRGTPGRGPLNDRRAMNDRAGTADDQVEALHAVAEQHPDDLDLDRVAVRGWSFGGYLAALCVLRHPDVFAAAIAGAPTTDERLYDTAYSERYLGHPDEQPEVYDANSLMPLAASLRRPLMIIHGLADDNVYPAHSLRLSAALLAAGRPHEFLPLTGVTHLAAGEDVAENLLLLQLDFLRRSLHLDPPTE